MSEVMMAEGAENVSLEMVEVKEAVKEEPTPKGKEKAASPTVEEKRKCSEFFPEESGDIPRLKKAVYSIYCGLYTETWLNKLQKLKEQLRSQGPPSPSKYIYKACEPEGASMSTLESNQEIATVRKDNMFSGEVTEQEMDIIAQRVAIQQRRFAEFERREFEQKARKIRTMFDYLSDDEIKHALKQWSNDEDEVIVQFAQPGYLSRLRKALAKKNEETVSAQSQTMTEEQREAYEQLVRKRTSTLKKSTTADAKQKYQRCGRLALDDALKQIQQNKVNPEDAMKGWSEARIKAYRMIDKNPNAYYYRFNAPGEEQRTGQWSSAEQKLFHARLKEIGANGQWGIFSMTIPGRVGYQCSNYYRHLIETSKIHDPNYVLDEKGKAHFLFKKKKKDGTVEHTFRTHSKHGTGRRSNADDSESGGGSSRPIRKTKAKRKRRNFYGSDDDDEDEETSDNYDDNDSGVLGYASWNTTRRTRARNAAPGEEVQEQSEQAEEEEEEEEADHDPENPLPGFVDPITLDEVVKPAISPYGHVMGYENWVRCLTSDAQRNICPLTKKPLTKRDLVLLTHENIAEYRDKIVNN
ncbi:hypothetical protein K493DRAFT_332660 [Basidiobolus meristosporus CBS 931.73]|uniref:Myb-like domain-containing protein n=1 Tax=Basidiobolus meristosporus CBS 931.73 TaxID=1314790 RepID=A0A1Y1ZBX0_9FUNG|nr:hypothetical protein K493DRAFT_332660 [Basidiobolus meristosporus CBS 931.73]|eukprot:ORY07750.1 hypothetical protein K493DRAFT_332660 [Basidiobolus meristosporus CBS 931.73]